MKRFWKDVTIENGAVLLDGRPVRTPGRLPLILPKESIADAVAAEWRAAPHDIDPHAMPMTGFANAAIERITPDPITCANDLAGYGETDLLCYRADNPPQLAARQAEVWDPLLGWARGRYDIAFNIIAGVMHQPQPRETIERLGAAIRARDPFELAPLSTIISIGGSLVVGLMLAEQAIEAEAAFDACHLDELWQAELWGEDALAVQTRQRRRSDFLSATSFLALARPSPA